MIQTHKLFGWHAVQAAVKHTPQKIVAAWVDGNRRDKKNEHLRQNLADLQIKVEPVDQIQLDRLSSRANHQGIVIEVELPLERNEKELKEAVAKTSEIPFFLILDQIQDPHNLGACFRTADATGIQGIVITKDRAVGLTPTVYKVASGGAETVPLYKVTNLVRTMQWLKTQGIWLIGTDATSRQTVYDSDFTVPLALVIGAEGKGLRRLTRDRCDLLIKLPMRGQVESLNLSVAAGVVLYEAVRQRTSVKGLPGC